MRLSNDLIHVLDVLPDVVVVIGEDGAVAAANGRAEALFGVASGDLTGRSAMTLVGGADAAGLAALLAASGPGLDRDGPGPVEMAAARADGTTVPALFLAVAVPGATLLVVRGPTTSRHEVERAQILLDTAPDAVVVVDAHGVVRLFNHQAEALFGWERDEIVGEALEVLIPDGSRAAHPRLRTGYLADPVPRPMGAGRELAGRRRDGSEFPAEISLSSVRVDGELLVSAAVRDVTERRRLVAKFEGLLESAPDAIVGVDAEGVIRLFNRQAEALFGWDRARITGRPVEELVPDRFRGGHPAHRTGYFTHPVTRPMGAGRELVALRADGTEFPAEISLSSLETEEGVLVSAAVRDVTERRKAEAQFRGLLEAAPDAMVGVGPDGTIVLVNSQTERLFGYSRDQLLGESVDILVPDSVRSLHPAHRDRYFAHPVTRPMGGGFELTARRADGSEFPCEISLSSLEGELGLLVTAAIRDVTERKRIQAEREQLQARQSERLESLGQLAGGIAHDFNNLLGLILSYGRFVAKKVKDDEELSEDVGEILAAAERAATLTRQLLIFGRREVVRPAVLDLNETVASTQKLLARTLGEHIHLVSELADGLPPVLADPGQLEQVVINLAVNARDAMEGGGTLSFRTDLVTPRDGTVEVRLTVSDSGSGMPPDVRARAFEPFFTTKPTGAGTGLGLATVHAIVAQAQGRVDLKSEVGEGTTVEVYLPPAVGNVEPVSHHHDNLGEVPAGAGQTILVVEDEPGVRQTTARMLSEWGYRVVEAGSGAAALEMCRSGDVTPDVLVTDVVMPGMSGADLAQAVNAVLPGLPVVFMSGYSHDVIARQGVLDPHVVLVEKPFTEDQMLRAVGGALTSRRAAGDSPA